MRYPLIEGQGNWGSPDDPKSLAAQRYTEAKLARYFFWSGNDLPKTAVADWQRSLRRLFEIANVRGAHAHRFRDTFAVELLLAGVPIDQVTILLGHSSVKITEKSYLALGEGSAGAAGGGRH